MTLTDALTEFLLARDYQPDTIRTYRQRLRAFTAWCHKQQPAVTTVGDLSTTLIRRYLEEQKTVPSEKTGRWRDSYTLHSHARSLFAWLNWLVEEECWHHPCPSGSKLRSGNRSCYGCSPSGKSTDCFWQQVMGLQRGAIPPSWQSFWTLGNAQMNSVANLVLSTANRLRPEQNPPGVEGVANGRHTNVGWLRSDAGAEIVWILQEPTEWLHLRFFGPFSRI